LSFQSSFDRKQGVQAVAKTPAGVERVPPPDYVVASTRVPVTTVEIKGL
jgi:hypothetical protein